MKYLAIAVLALLGACSRAEQPPPTDTREPIEISYVTAPALRVHAQPNDASPLVLTYENGEAVSVMSKKGDWVEVRVGDRTGWGHAADLGSAKEAKQQEENPEVRFRVFPSPVSNPSAHGEIYLEADVNTDGDVVGVRTIGNSTGSEALAAENAASLQQAKFYPIVKKGQRKPFKYYHRVTY
ncbi:MAG TPA: SH3 domain-containing protein [Thermoanaerobaculia bacterium]